MEESLGTFGAEPTLNGEKQSKKNGKSEAQPQDMIHRNVDYLRPAGQNQEIGASLISESQPFKHGLLDTLESHSLNTFIKPRAAP